MAALIAKQYRIGRIFLAGDAAHRLPPTGGFGMNTGIQDIHNLSWKLAMVIRGIANESILDTYFSERVQIAKVNTELSIKNAKRFNSIFTALVKNDLDSFKQELQTQTNHINNILFDLGFIYGSEYETRKTYKQSAEVGARAPHCWLLKDHYKSYSTLDLFSNQFVLVCHPEALHWRKKYSDFPCAIITIGKNGDYLDQHNDFCEKYDISKTGAVLVRPDGHIAWRTNEINGEMPHFSWLLYDSK